jgi:cytoskeletal protein CcmA (bactofilin family)
MPNPLKVLVDLQARRNVSVSSTLEVTGSTTLAGLTATGATINGNVSGSGTLQIGGLSTLTQLTASTVDINGGAIDGVVIGAASQAAAQFTTLSASSTLQAGGAATLAGGLTVTGAALNASAVAVSASALNVTNDISARSASLSGDLTVVGNLTVVGTTTQIESTTVNIGDKNISLGTGSTNLAVLSDGGIDLGTSAQVQWRYNNGSTAWKSNVDVDVASTKVYKVNGTEVLSSNALGNGVTASSLTSVGTLSSLTVSGLTNLSGNVNLGDASSDVVTALGQLTASQGVSVATGKTYQVNGVDILSATELKSSVVSASLAFNNSSLNVIGSLTASVDVKATGKLYAATTGTLGNAFAANNAGVLDVAHAILLLDDSINGASGASAGSIQAAYNKVRLVTTGSFSGGSATINLSSSAGANAAYFVGEQKHYLSVDVLVRNGAADADWENDLVAVHLSGSGTGSGAVSVVIDALTEATEYRLIVVNEKSGSFVI